MNGRESPAAPPRGRLLVVDDNFDVLDSIRMVLEDFGHEVEVAENGRVAVERVRTGARFDLVLCDVGMPELNGWQVAERIQDLAPGTKVFLLTGGADQIAPGDPRRSFVTGVLSKPIELDELEQLLVRQLEAR